MQDSMSRLSASGAVLNHRPPEYVEDEDVLMDDVNSLTADCIIDLDELDDSLPDSQVHVYRRASDDNMQEDEDEIEDDDDD